MPTFDYDEDEEMDCPMTCMECGRVVELDDLWPDPDDELWFPGPHEAKFCRRCYVAVLAERADTGGS